MPYRIAKELLGLYPGKEIKPGSVTERSFEDVKLLCEKMNKINFGIEEDEKVQCQKINGSHFEVEETLKLFSSIDISTYETYIEEKADIIAFEKLSIDSCIEHIEAGINMCGIGIDKHVFYIEIVNKVLFKTQNMKLRPTQKIAVLFTLKSYKSSCSSANDDNAKSGILQQIATSEGKTLIIAVVSIISVLEKHKVNIVTSSPVLAKRDAHDQTSEKLFKTFGIKVDHICYDSAKTRTEVYKTCHVVYGDLTNYQRDYLTDTYNSTHVASQRERDIIISDEVDALLLDNGINTLYLSHNIADFEMLHSLIIHIWDLVNCHIKNGGACKTESFYQKLRASIFPVFPSKDLPAILEITENEAKSFKNILLQNKIIDNDDLILITRKDMLQQKFKSIQKNYSENETSVFTHFIHKYDKIMGGIYGDLPEHLKPYVKMHLKEFITNAEIAFRMEPDVEYQVAVPKITTLKERVEPQIIIIDRDSGIHLQKTHWHKGLHQFLQLKHGLRLTALSTKAVFISNITFLNKFPTIYGFSGTLGSETEKQELYKFYKLKSVIIPSSNVKEFYEERAIITKTEFSQYKEIFDTVQEKMAKGRSVLIIADSVKQVDLISFNIKKLAENNLSENERKCFTL
uniref:Chloroplast protein-transporting ATPase n=1 Tax=Panagrolaimus davidi TaxID=227884 RepID=A0A914PAK7_9BILA